MKNFLPILLMFSVISTGAQNISLNSGETYAVVVGISDYQDEQIPDLRFADRDAEAFANFLRSPAGGSLQEDYLQVLLNEQATAAQFAKALDWLMDVARENDRVIIYFSGHGDVEKKTITQPGYFLCWDAPSRVYLAGGALALPIFQNVISTLSIQNKAKVIVISDACRSGKLSGSSVNGAQLTNSNLAQQYANEIKILSCQPEEYSIEGEQWGQGRGAFSFHLLEGLYGLADEDDDLIINLKEIDRYLEDNVSAEVAPHNQNPMTVGNKTERLTTVFPEILDQIREGRRGQLHLFTTTESKGIEEDVLAQVDSNIVDMYFAFKQTLQDKQFLCAPFGEPEYACADYFYEKLIQEPKLEKLHSSMRRNYAAALQDDAQQVMNIMLKSGLTEQVLKAAKVEEIYKNYPRYIARAAELLGETHYMYVPLQARKHFFEGMIQGKRSNKRQEFRKALDWQPEMAHAMVYLTRNFEAEQVDSAEHYFEQAASLIPSWVEPYVALAFFYRYQSPQPEKVEALLNRAGQVDSSSILVAYEKALHYFDQGQMQLAEKWYLKTIEGTGKDVCFPCAHNDLGRLYTRSREYEKAEKHYKKAIQLDSSMTRSYAGLGSVYNSTQRYDEAEKTLKKGIQIDSTYAPLHNNLGVVYSRTNRFEEAERHLKIAIELNPNNRYATYALGTLYSKNKYYEKAEEYFKQAIQLDSTYLYAHNNLAVVYLNTKQFDKAELVFNNIIKIDSTHSAAWVNLGDIYVKTNRPEKVETAFFKALEGKLTFAYPFAHTGLGNFYLEKEKYDESEDHFKKAIDLNTKFYRAYKGLGMLYLITGKLNESKNILDQVLEINPDYSAAYILLSVYEHRNNRILQSWDNLDKGLEKGFSDYEYLQSEPFFEALRKEIRWRELMEKYFPDQFNK